MATTLPVGPKIRVPKSPSGDRHLEHRLLGVPAVPGSQPQDTAQAELVHALTFAGISGNLEGSGSQSPQYG